MAASIAIGNYVARVMYNGVTNGFGSQSWLTWVLPLAVLIGMLVICSCFGFAVYVYRKKKKWPLCACTWPKGEDGAAGAATPSALGPPGALGATTNA